MSRKYDDYGYEKDDRGNSSLSKKLLIIVMIVIAILLILYLLRSCNSGKTSGNDNQAKKVFDYESVLLEGGRNYFNNNIDENPTVPGECNNVELQTLITNKYVDATKFGNCNVNTSYVRVCVLQNGTKQYTPWLACTDKNSENEYAALKEGLSTEIIANKTYVEFKFLPQAVRKGEEQLGNVEELWKEDIKYDSYKTLATTTYYRYRDKLYTWNLTTRYYYTRSGDKINSNEVNEYYASMPRTGYSLTSDKTTEAYKWYTSESQREYYMVNGAKMPSANPVGEYNIRDPKGIDFVRYRTRTVTSTYKPTQYYICAANATTTTVVYTYEKCSSRTDGRTYQRGTIYSCARPTNGSDSIIGMQVGSANSTCNTYSDWSDFTTTACDLSKTDTCQKYTGTVYYWYKNVNEKRTYYPSGASSASGESVYYTEAPVKEAIKDTSTKTTAYKWYKESRTTTSQYTATPPSGYTTATKTSSYKWSDWSDWSTKNPKTSDGRDRSIETKSKIKLQQILGTSSDGWDNLSDQYISEQEMIDLYQSKNYDVKSLSDINNNGEIKYQLKLFIRNRKENK